MTKYRKKPVVIEAVQYVDESYASFAKVRKLAGKHFTIVEPEDRLEDPDIVAQVYDKLHATWVGVKVGQWIIKGVQGEFYPCDSEVFDATYETVV